MWEQHETKTVCVKLAFVGVMNEWHNCI